MHDDDAAKEAAEGEAADDARRTAGGAEDTAGSDAPVDDASSETPFSGLTPERVLDALESIGLACDGRLLTLNSYENRVYLAGLDDGTERVAKFYRPHRWTDAQVLEEHAFVDELASREIPVVPPLTSDDRTLHVHRGQRFAVFERRGGRAPELDDVETRKWLGRFLGRIHAVGAIDSYRHRPALDRDTFGREPRAWIVESRIVPAPLDVVWTSVVDQALEGVEACERRAGLVRRLRLHGDCHAGNILWTETHARGTGGPHFVDFDDSCTGPAMQDLWMLLSGDRDDMTRQCADLLEGYARFHDFDARELQLLEALRTLRIVHYCAWIARRWDDPAFPAAFPFFGSERYWQNQILALREQVAAMDEPPLAP